jgi:hypothetical protein
VASFLWGHGEKQRMLPTFGIVQTAETREFSVNARRRVATMFGARTHDRTIPGTIFTGKGGSLT